MYVEIKIESYTDDEHDLTVDATPGSDPRDVHDRAIEALIQALRGVIESREAL